MAQLAGGRALLAAVGRAFLRSCVTPLSRTSRMAWRSTGAPSSSSAASAAATLQLPSSASERPESGGGASVDSDDGGFSEEKIVEIIKEQEGSLPIEGLANPYLKPHKKCIICQYNVPLDYKNVRLLSQFISPHTGRIYGNRVTGLCIPMQQRISKLIRRARYMGLMPYMYRDPQFIKDPLITARKIKK